MSDSSLHYGELHGQVALVTGATSGLGRRFALVLAEAGAAVIAAGRREERLAETAAEITAAGGSCLPLQLDLTDIVSIARGVDRAEAAFGTVTILVNNAAIPDAQRAHRTRVDIIDAVIDTNLRGPWVLATEVGTRLIETGNSGRIVNLSSMGAFHYTEGAAAALYSVTKAAAARMTEVLAVEWAQYGINVNSIAPGAFLTEMMEGMLERTGAQFSDLTDPLPRKRLGRPEQLDSTLLYLCSPASELVTGTVIKVDDGQEPR